MSRERNNSRDKGRQWQFKGAEMEERQMRKGKLRQMWVNETDNGEQWCMAWMIVFQGPCQIEQRMWGVVGVQSGNLCNSNVLPMTHHLKRHWWMLCGTPAFTWRGTDHRHKMTRGHYNGSETKMLLNHNSWCDTNDSWQFLDGFWKDKWWILDLRKYFRQMPEENNRSGRWRKCTAEVGGELKGLKWPTKQV